VALFRRRPSDPALDAARDAFRRVAAELDAAQQALLASVPTSRDPGTPLGDAIDAFAAGLARVDALMPGWRLASTEDAWGRCAGALRESRRRADALRAGGSTLGFELLNARLGEVIDPLEEFADAGDELRRR
jgi:hypothetical protein